MKKNTKSSKIKPAQLNLLNPKCAGIDVGAAEIFVCIAKTPFDIYTYSLFIKYKDHLTKCF